MISNMVLDGFTPLFYALQNTYGAIVELLLQAGVNLETKNGVTRTSVEHFFSFILWHSLRLVTSKFPSFSLFTVQDGLTALLYATKESDYALIERLLEAGSNIEAIDEVNRSAFMCRYKKNS